MPRDRSPKEQSKLEPCLVVEDDSIIMLDLVHTLRQLGLEDLKTALTVSSAEKLLVEFDVRFAILDYALGKANSLGIASTLAARGTPFVFLTAHESDIDLPPELSHVPVLPKPFTTAQLASALRSAVVTIEELPRGDSYPSC